MKQAKAMKHATALSALAGLMGLIGLIALPAMVQAQSSPSYFPAPGQWQHKTPEELGFDPAKLRAAIEFAQAHDSGWDFGKDQQRVFGTPLGPVPAQRAATNGVIVRHGYIVAQFGDTKANDPVYSIAKSFLSTVCSLAVARGLIRDVNDPVAQYIHDGGYDSAHNAKITWKNHLQQESEWEGVLWGKNADFVGHEQYGEGEHKPRPIQDPGTYYEYNDVRVNRFSLSLLRLFGQPLPDVLRSSIMDPIGATHEWRWIAYPNATVDIGGRQIGSVPGGTRWGGGLWINSEDLARFGLLILNHGRWQAKQLVSEQWLAQAVTPSAHGPDYGYLWWLNTKQQEWPSAPASSFAAVGNGSNTVWMDPQHDLVIVYRWHDHQAMDGLIQRVVAAIAR
jgi:CubicO group peptidase (beta-lactamase class C family)